MLLALSNVSCTSRRLLPLSALLAALTIILVSPGAAQTVTGKDLIIDSGTPTMNPPVIPPGGTSYLSSWRVRNRGTLSTGVTFYNGYYLSADRSLSVTADVNIGGNTNAVLASGAATTWPAVPFTFPSVTPEGTYYICVYADNTNRVPEVYENNNVAVAKVIVSRRPDLVFATSHSITPTTIDAGLAVSTSWWTLRNQGPGSAAASYAGFYLSPDAAITTADTLLSSVYISALSPGQNLTQAARNITIPATVRAGNYYLGILADRLGQIPEADESNNYVAVPLTVTTPPEVQLAGSSIALGWEGIAPGQPIQYPSFTVTNTGSRPTPQIACDVFLSADQAYGSGDTMLGRQYVPPINPGQSYTVPAFTITMPENRPIAYYYLGLMLDSLHWVTENNEDNNTYFNRFYLGILPDAQVWQIPNASPNAVFQGATVKIGPVTIINSGDTNIITPFYCRFALSTDRTITSADTLLGKSGIRIDTLARGATYTIPQQTFTIPTPFKAGSYYVALIADQTGVLWEKRENNNITVSTGSFQVY